ncbi:MAG: thioredoxin family protein [Saprospiraceae bacterium]
MKNILFLFTLISLTATSAVAQDGVSFSKNLKWKEILAKAASENKVVFLDAYTTWCGPCKKMTRDIFPQKAIGDLFNDKFVNIKMDMEKGEGVAIAEQYNIKAYPTLLFIAGDGSLVHRAAGYHTVPQLLDLADVALSPGKSLSSLEKKYNEGNREPDFLHSYAKARWEAMDGSHGKIADEYLATQKDWSTTENMRFLFTFLADTDSKMFEYLIANKARFEEMYGKPTIAGRVQELIYNKIYDSKDASALEQIDVLFAKAYPEDEAKILSANFRLMYYRQAGDRENYAKSAVKFFKKYKKKATTDQLNDAAWTFYEVIDNKKQLKQAVRWAKESIKRESNYYNNDTLAALYYKLGKKKKALKTANKAIVLAKENNLDHAETDNLITKINEL